MYDSLEFYLSKWTNPTKKAIVNDALNVLALYSETGTAEAIGLRLENSSVFTAQENMDAIESCLLDGLRNVLLAMNLSLNGTVQDLAKILRGFHTLTTWEDHETIVNEINLGGDPFEIINSLLEMVDFEASVAWQSCITFETLISDGLLIRLREVHDSVLAMESEMPEPISEAKQARYNRLRNFFGKYPECVGYQLLQDGVSPGLPLSTLLNLSRTRLLQTDENQTTVLASSVISLVLMSDTADSNIIGVARELVDDIWIDNQTIQSVTTAIDSIGQTNI